jgi:polysaccharide biosynthesis/export protein
MSKLLVAMLGVGMLGMVQGPQGEYRIGPQDVLTITVYDQPELSGRFSVENDGGFMFPFVGRVKASGLTPREVETDIRERLAQGFLRNPQVTLTIEHYRSQRIFVMGEVRSPGTYQLTGGMTLIEAVARAGSTLPSAADEVLVVRPPGGKTVGPVMPGEGLEVETIRVSLAAVQAGALNQNVPLRDGDTVMVQRAKAVYISGQVKNPGAYPIEKDTTVLQAITLAGGLTDRGSTRGLRLIRVVDGKKREIRVRLDDTVEPGDTILVRERLF